MTYNEWLEIEVKRLNNENDNIKNFFSYNELELLNEITRLKDEKTILNHKLSIQLEENTKYRIDCKLWIKEYYEVVEENDKQDDYIDNLKQELFNLYLKHYN